MPNINFNEDYDKDDFYRELIYTLQFNDPAVSSSRNSWRDKFPAHLLPPGLSNLHDWSEVVNANENIDWLPGSDMSHGSKNPYDVNRGYLTDDFKQTLRTDEMADTIFPGHGISNHYMEDTSTPGFDNTIKGHTINWGEIERANTGGWGSVRLGTNIWPKKEENPEVWGQTHDYFKQNYPFRYTQFKLKYGDPLKGDSSEWEKAVEDFLIDKEGGYNSPWFNRVDEVTTGGHYSQEGSKGVCAEGYIQQWDAYGNRWICVEQKVFKNESSGFAQDKPITLETKNIDLLPTFIPELPAFTKQNVNVSETNEETNYPKYLKFNDNWEKQLKRLGIWDERIQKKVNRLNTHPSARFKNVDHSDLKTESSSNVFGIKDWNTGRLLQDGDISSGSLYWTEGLGDRWYERYLRKLNKEENRKNKWRRQSSGVTTYKDDFKGWDTFTMDLYNKGNQTFFHPGELTEEDYIKYLQSHGVNDLIINKILNHTETFSDSEIQKIIDQDPVIMEKLNTSGEPGDREVPKTLQDYRDRFGVENYKYGGFLRKGQDGTNTDDDVVLDTVDLTGDKVEQTYYPDYDFYDISGEKQKLIEKLQTDAFKDRYYKHYENLTGKQMTDEEYNQRLADQIAFIQGGSDQATPIMYTRNEEGNIDVFEEGKGGKTIYGHMSPTFLKDYFNTSRGHVQYLFERDENNNIIEDENGNPIITGWEMSLPGAKEYEAMEWMTGPDGYSQFSGPDGVHPLAHSTMQHEISHLYNAPNSPLWRGIDEYNDSNPLTGEIFGDHQPWYADDHTRAIEEIGAGRTMFEQALKDYGIWDSNKGEFKDRHLKKLERAIAKNDDFIRDPRVGNYLFINANTDQGITTQRTEVNEYLESLGLANPTDWYLSDYGTGITNQISPRLMQSDLTNSLNIINRYESKYPSIPSREEKRKRDYDGSWWRNVKRMEKEDHKMMKNFMSDKFDITEIQDPNYDIIYDLKGSFIDEYMQRGNIEKLGVYEGKVDGLAEYFTTGDTFDYNHPGFKEMPDEFRKKYEVKFNELLSEDNRNNLIDILNRTSKGWNYQQGNLWDDEKEVRIPYTAQQLTDEDIIFYKDFEKQYQQLSNQIQQEIYEYHKHKIDQGGKNVKKYLNEWAMDNDVDETVTAKDGKEINNLSQRIANNLKYNEQNDFDYFGIINTDNKLAKADAGKEISNIITGLAEFKNGGDIGKSFLNFGNKFGEENVHILMNHLKHNNKTKNLKKLQDGGDYMKFITDMMNNPNAFKERLKNITPIGYDVKHAFNEVVANKKLPTYWDGKPQTWETWGENLTFINEDGEEVSAYTKENLELIKNTSTDAWHLYLGYKPENKTMSKSVFKPTVDVDNPNATYYSFNNPLDIWGDIKHSGILDYGEEDFKNFWEESNKNKRVPKGYYNTAKFENKSKGEKEELNQYIQVLDSSAGGFALKDYQLSKGYDEEIGLPYIAYYDIFDFDIPLAGRSIKGSKVAGNPYEIYGRLYYDANYTDEDGDPFLIPQEFIGSYNIDFNDFEKGIRWAESKNGILMENPNSSATGLYQQLYDQIKEEYGGTREQFKNDLAAQEFFFKRRQDGDLRKCCGVNSDMKDGMDLWHEFFNIFQEHGKGMPLTPIEVASLVYFQGKSGARRYIKGSLLEELPLSDVIPENISAINKNPTEYLEETQSGIRKYKTGGETGKTERENIYEALQKYESNQQVDKSMYEKLLRLGLVGKTNKEKEEEKIQKQKLKQDQKKKEEKEKLSLTSLWKEFILGGKEDKKNKKKKREDIGYSPIKIEMDVTTDLANKIQNEEYLKAAKTFNQSLQDNKSQIMKATNIDDANYNHIITLAQDMFGEQQNNSGMYNITYEGLSSDEKGILKSLGVISNEDFSNPYKAGIAYATVLALKSKLKLSMGGSLPMPSSYSKLSKLYSADLGTEITDINDKIRLYDEYVNGKFDDHTNKDSMEKLYDKFNRQYYYSAKDSDMPIYDFMKKTSDELVKAQDGKNDIDKVTGKTKREIKSQLKDEGWNRRQRRQIINNTDAEDLYERDVDGNVKLVDYYSRDYRNAYYARNEDGDLGYSGAIATWDDTLKDGKGDWMRWLPTVNLYANSPETDWIENKKNNQSWFAKFIGRDPGKDWMGIEWERSMQNPYYNKRMYETNPVAKAVMDATGNQPGSAPFGYDSWMGLMGDTPYTLLGIPAASTIGAYGPTVGAPILNTADDFAMWLNRGPVGQNISRLWNYNPSKISGTSGLLGGPQYKIPGLTLGNTINSGFAAHGVTNIGPNIYDFSQDPSWGGAGNVGINLLEMSPLYGPTWNYLKSGTSYLGSKMPNFRGTPVGGTTASNRPARVVSPEANVEYQKHLQYLKDNNVVQSPYLQDAIDGSSSVFLKQGDRVGYLTISKLDDGTYVYKNHASATAGKPQIDPKILQQAEDIELKINELRKIREIVNKNYFGVDDAVSMKEKVNLKNQASKLSFETTGYKSVDEVDNAINSLINEHRALNVNYTGSTIKGASANEPLHSIQLIDDVDLNKMNVELNRVINSMNSEHNIQKTMVNTGMNRDQVIKMHNEWLDELIGSKTYIGDFTHSSPYYNYSAMYSRNIAGQQGQSAQDFINSQKHGGVMFLNIKDFTSKGLDWSMTKGNLGSINHELRHLLSPVQTPRQLDPYQIGRVHIEVTNKLRELYTKKENILKDSNIPDYIKRSRTGEIQRQINYWFGEAEAYKTLHGLDPLDIKSLNVPIDASFDVYKNYPILRSSKRGMGQGSDLQWYYNNPQEQQVRYGRFREVLEDFYGLGKESKLTKKQIKAVGNDLDYIMNNIDDYTSMRWIKNMGYTDDVLVDYAKSHPHLQLDPSKMSADDVLEFIRKNDEKLLKLENNPIFKKWGITAEETGMGAYDDVLGLITKIENSAGKPLRTGSKAWRKEVLDWFNKAWAIGPIGIGVGTTLEQQE